MRGIYSLLCRLVVFVFAFHCRVGCGFQSIQQTHHGLVSLHSKILTALRQKQKGARQVFLMESPYDQGAFLRLGPVENPSGTTGGDYLQQADGEDLSAGLYPSSDIPAYRRTGKGGLAWPVRRLRIGLSWRRYCNNKGCFPYYDSQAKNRERFFSSLKTQVSSLDWMGREWVPHWGAASVYCPAAVRSP
jgi:hypothetical protein